MSKKLLIIPALFFALLFLFPTTAHAFSLSDIVDGFKSFFLPEAKKELTVESKLDLAPNGDVDKNGQIDAGDYVRFTYIISNPTKEIYKFAKLDTSVNTKELNTINNVQGVLSLDEENNTIIIPNLTVSPNQVRKISFDARINFSKDTDQSISTEAEFLDNKNKSIFKAQKQELSAKKMDTEKFNKFVHITK